MTATLTSAQDLLRSAYEFLTTKNEIKPNHEAVNQTLKIEPSKEPLLGDDATPSIAENESVESPVINAAKKEITQKLSDLHEYSSHSKHSKKENKKRSEQVRIIQASETYRGSSHKRKASFDSKKQR
jgi:outer membrane translocation and assembly module TamA